MKITSCLWSDPLVKHVVILSLILGTLGTLGTLGLAGCAVTSATDCRAVAADFRNATVRDVVPNDEEEVSFSLELSLLSDAFESAVTPALRATLPDGTSIRLGVFQHTFDGSRCPACLDVTSAGNGIVEFDGQRHQVEGFRLRWRGKIQVDEDDGIGEVRLVPESIAILELPEGLEEIVKAPVIEQLELVRPVVLRTRALEGSSILVGLKTSKTHLSVGPQAPTGNRFRIPANYIRRSAQEGVRRTNDQLTVSDLSLRGREVDVAVARWRTEGVCGVDETTLSGRLTNEVTLGDDDDAWLEPADIRALAQGIADATPTALLLSPRLVWTRENDAWSGAPSNTQTIDVTLMAMGSRCSGDFDGQIIMAWDVDQNGRASNPRVIQNTTGDVDVEACLLNAGDTLDFGKASEARIERRALLFTRSSR